MKYKVMIDDKWFRYQMDRNNVSTNDLAVKLGISDDTMNKKINGQIRFNLTDIIHTLLVFDMKFEELFKIK